MPKTLVGEREPPTTVTVLVDRALRTKLEAAAKASERSLGGEVRYILRHALGHEEEVEAA